MWMSGRSALPVAWIILVVCDQYLAIYINSVSTITGTTFWIVRWVYSLAVTLNTKERKKLHGLRSRGKIISTFEYRLWLTYLRNDKVYELKKKVKSVYRTLLTNTTINIRFYKDGLDLWPVPYISLWDGPVNPESNQLDGRTEGSRTLLSRDVADRCEWDSIRAHRSLYRTRYARVYINILD